MARNRIFIAASPAQVFDVLADPRTYAQWVAGTRRVRAADADWPDPGSELHHEVSYPPLAISDRTSVIASTPPHQLILRARARPLPDARVTLNLRDRADGTEVTMIEDPVNPLLSLLSGPLGHGMVRLRNRCSLGRLKALAEGAMPRAPAPPPRP